MHGHVSQLRTSLTAAADGNGSANVVVTREHGYELRLDPERLDANRFERLLAEGRSELAAGRSQSAAATLEGGLALWRGPPLADRAYEQFAQPEVALLDQLKVVALELLIEAKLALGRHAELVGQLETLIAEHPYRERLRAHLMLARYRCDRQADALQATRMRGRRWSTSSPAAPCLRAGSSPWPVWSGCERGGWRWHDAPHRGTRSPRRSWFAGPGSLIPCLLRC